MTKLVSALLDSGSFVNVISKELLEHLCGSLPWLSPTEVSISSVATQPLQVLGSVQKKIHINIWRTNYDELLNMSSGVVQPTRGHNFEHEL